MTNGYSYTGVRTPFGVQKITVEMLTTNKRAYVLSGMGVGKTACPLWAFDYLRRTGQATRMLVVAPLSTLEFTWVAELLQISSPYTSIVLHGSRERRLKRLNTNTDIYIINHDGVGVCYEELMRRHDIDVLVLDELAVYRNRSNRTKTMKKLAAAKKWVWGMTGSPTPQAPTDVWNQANIVTPWTVPTYFSRFREEVMIKGPQGSFKWFPRANAADKAYAVLQPSVRFTLEDVTELPDYISRRIDVPMGSRQGAIYDEIRKGALAIVQGEQISAVNAGVLINKLLQISLGYVYSDKKGIVALDNKPRLQAIVDLLDATADPCLVFCPYRHALAGIAQAVRDAGYVVATMDGSTPVTQRGKIFDAFQNKGAYKAIIAHPQCLAHGVTLTEASTTIWAGPIASLEIYDQANARIRRVGQTKKQSFYHLQSTQVENKMYSALINKQDLQNKLLDLFEDDMLTQ